MQFIFSLWIYSIQDGIKFTSHENYHRRRWHGWQNVPAHHIHTKWIPQRIRADCVRQSCVQHHRRWQRILADAVGYGRPRRLRTTAPIELPECKCIILLLFSAYWLWMLSICRRNASCCAIRYRARRHSQTCWPNGIQKFVISHQVFQLFSSVSYWAAAL